MRLVKSFYLLLALIIGLLIVLKSVDYLHPDFSKGFLIGKEANFHFYRVPLYAHMLGAPLALLAGIYQFAFTRSRLHKSTGKLYLILVLFLAAPSGLIMSFYAIGGIVSTINFALMSVLWAFFSVKAYHSIRLGKVARHRQFMSRSFILANSAILIRLFSFINNHYGLTDVTTGYIIIAWLSWLPGLLLYELWLRNRP